MWEWGEFLSEPYLTRNSDVDIFSGKVIGDVWEVGRESRLLKGEFAIWDKKINMTWQLDPGCGVWNMQCGVSDGILLSLPPWWHLSISWRTGAECVNRCCNKPCNNWAREPCCETPSSEGDTEEVTIFLSIYRRLELSWPCGDWQRWWWPRETSWTLLGRGPLGRVQVKGKNVTLGGRSGGKCSCKQQRPRQVRVVGSGGPSRLTSDSRGSERQHP